MLKSLTMFAPNLLQNPQRIATQVVSIRETHYRSENEFRNKNNPFLIEIHTFRSHSITIDQIEKIEAREKI